MIDHPKSFLLKKIVGYKTNGLESLGHLHAKHVDDLAAVLKEYAEWAYTDTIERIAKKELKIKLVK